MVPGTQCTRMNVRMNIVHASTQSCKLFYKTSVCIRRYMYARIHINISIYLSVCLSIYLSIYLSVYDIYIYTYYVYHRFPNKQHAHIHIYTRYISPATNVSIASWASVPLLFHGPSHVQSSHMLLLLAQEGSLQDEFPVGRKSQFLPLGARGGRKKSCGGW